MITTTSLFGGTVNNVQLGFFFFFSRLFRAMSCPFRRSCELKSSSWRTPWPRCAKSTRCCASSLSRTWQPTSKQVFVRSGPLDIFFFFSRSVTHYNWSCLLMFVNLRLDRCTLNHDISRNSSWDVTASWEVFLSSSPFVLRRFYHAFKLKLSLGEEPPKYSMCIMMSLLWNVQSKTEFTATDDVEWLKVKPHVGCFCLLSLVTARSGPINREMRHLISSLQNHNLQLKGDVQRYKRKLRETQMEINKVDSYTYVCSLSVRWVCFSQTVVIIQDVMSASVPAIERQRHCIFRWSQFVWTWFLWNDLTKNPQILTLTQRWTLRFFGGDKAEGHYWPIWS